MTMANASWADGRGRTRKGDLQRGFDGASFTAAVAAGQPTTPTPPTDAPGRPPVEYSMSMCKNRSSLDIRRFGSKTPTAELCSTLRRIRMIGSGIPAAIPALHNRGWAGLLFAFARSPSRIGKAARSSNDKMPQSCANRAAVRDRKC